MRAFRLWNLSIVLILLLTACAPAKPKPRGTWEIEIYGADEHEITGGEVIFEGWSHARKIWFQKFEKGDENDVTHIVEFRVPYGIKPGTYKVKEGGQITANFSNYHVETGFGSYDKKCNGTLTVIEAGKVFTGKIDFTASTNGFAGPVEKVRVVASFEDIPYTRLSDAPFQPGIDDAPNIEKPAVGIRPLAALSIVFLFLIVALSVSIQVYVGRQVYAGHNPVMIFLLASNPTRTYLRGWRVQGLNRVMKFWTLLILLAVLAMCMLFFATQNQ